MSSIVLLMAVTALIAIPGAGAARGAFGPYGLSPVTRLAAVFGLGYAVTAGSAFALAAAHVFWLAPFLALWLAATAVLWWLALRRFPFPRLSRLRTPGRIPWAALLRDHLPFLIGLAVVTTMVTGKFGYLHLVAGGAHYVYYLNGVEIANSHGVPARTLEYGQAWPPATDKIVLDSFTAIIPPLCGNPLLGPGVLLVLSFAGAAVGLWASATELGLRRTGALLPLLLLANLRVLGPGLSGGFAVYRAEDFGMAVAFCALPLGITAIREGGRRRAVAAAAVLAAAAGSHLIPVLIVVSVLAWTGIATLLRAEPPRTRRAVLRDALVTAGLSGVIWTSVRLFAGGTLGLGGASSQDSYGAGWAFDPTEYLYTGHFAPRNPPEAGHFYVPPLRVLSSLMEAATGLAWGTGQWLALLGGTLAVALLLFFATRGALGAAGLAGFGTLAILLLLGLGFSFYYHVWIDATFGIRRLSPYASAGLVLTALALAEGLTLAVDRLRLRMRLDQVRARLSLAEVQARIAGQGSAMAVVPVAALTAWVAPTAPPSVPPGAGPGYVPPQALSASLVAFASWARTRTPCGARFLVNSRPEGTMTALTGRLDLSEGMGSFLRPGTFPYVTGLMLSARSFFIHPWKGEAFLRRHGVNYVVVSAVNNVIGYPGPLGWTNVPSLNTAPFLDKIWDNGTVSVYQVRNSPASPVSPLLRGPYLHCETSPLGY